MTEFFRRDLSTEDDLRKQFFHLTTGPDGSLHIEMDEWNDFRDMGRLTRDWERQGVWAERDFRAHFASDPEVIAALNEAIRTTHAAN